jgi:hypothetical protein
MPMYMAMMQRPHCNGWGTRVLASYDHNAAVCDVADTRVLAYSFKVPQQRPRAPSIHGGMVARVIAYSASLAHHAGRSATACDVA